MEYTTCHVLATGKDFYCSKVLFQKFVSLFEIINTMTLNFRTRDLTLYYARYLWPAAFTYLDIMIYSVSSCRPPTHWHNFVQTSSHIFNEFKIDTVKDIHMTVM